MITTIIKELIKRNKESSWKRGALLTVRKRILWLPTRSTTTNSLKKKKTLKNQHMHTYTWIIHVMCVVLSSVFHVFCTVSKIEKRTLTFNYNRLSSVCSRKVHLCDLIQFEIRIIKSECWYLNNTTVTIYFICSTLSCVFLLLFHKSKDNNKKPVTFEQDYLPLVVIKLRMMLLEYLCAKFLHLDRFQWRPFVDSVWLFVCNHWQNWWSNLTLNLFHESYQYQAVRCFDFDFHLTKKNNHG